MRERITTKLRNAFYRLNGYTPSPYQLIQMYRILKDCDLLKENNGEEVEQWKD